MKTIEINTTQNVTIEYELAPLRERALAWLLDVVIVIVLFYVLRNLILALFGSALGSDDNIGWFTVIGLLPFLCYFAYNFSFEIWNIGQTPGKMAMGLKVVRLDGKEPEWTEVLLRTLLHLIDSLFSFGVIGSVMIKTGARSQRLGDLAAHTTVIKIQGTRFQFKLQDILSISSLDNYTPVYPQVRKLSEQDMIFIKNLLTRNQRYPNNSHHDAVEDLVTRLMEVLEISVRPYDRIEFLKTLLRDYIVLTR